MFFVRSRHAGYKNISILSVSLGFLAQYILYLNHVHAKHNANWFAHPPYHRVVWNPANQLPVANCRLCMELLTKMCFCGLTDLCAAWSGQVWDVLWGPSVPVEPRQQNKANLGASKINMWTTLLPKITTWNHQICLWLLDQVRPIKSINGAMYQSGLAPRCFPCDLQYWPCRRKACTVVCPGPPHLLLEIVETCWNVETKWLEQFLILWHGGLLAFGGWSGWKASQVWSHLNQIQ